MHEYYTKIHFKNDSFEHILEKYAILLLCILERHPTVMIDIGTAQIANVCGLSSGSAINSCASIFVTSDVSLRLYAVYHPYHKAEEKPKQIKMHSHNRKVA